jgi:hypothetical protein
MKRLFLILAVVLLSQGSLWAQDVPVWEGWGGFSLLSAGGGGPRFNPVGWQGGAAFNVNDRLALVGDFGGQYKDGDKLHQYLGGVRTGMRRERFSAFAHALYGGTHSSSTGGSINAFTMAYGGGLDINAGERMAVRVVQFDWLPTRFSGGVWENNIIRLGFGVVFKVGAR